MNNINLNILIFVHFYLIITILSNDNINIDTNVHNNNKDNSKSFLTSWQSKDLIVLCLQKMINFTELTIEYEESVIERNQTEFFKRHCLLKDPLIHCVNMSYPRYFGVALTIAETIQKESDIELISNILEYVCYREGIRLTGYFNDDGLNCVDENKLIITSCFQNTFINDSFMINNTIAVNCAGMKMVKHCVIFNLMRIESCNRQEIFSFNNGLFYTIFDDNLCKNRSLESQTVIVTTDLDIISTSDDPVNNSTDDFTETINNINTNDTEIEEGCADNKFFQNCSLIVKGGYCDHKYYSKFCCKSCFLAEQLNRKK